MRSVITFIFAALAITSIATAQTDAFSTGPLIEDFGPVAEVPGSTPIPEGAVFRIAYDFTDAAEPGELNRSLVTAARFLNMHAAAGVAPEDMQLAIVLHSKVIRDVTNAAHYSQHHGETPNANAPLIAELVKHGVTFHVCGQSAAYYGVSVDDLLPGVEMSLSAMTSHALLQQNGYTLNPF